MSPVSNAPLPLAPGWPMQHGAAFKMSAAIDQRQTIPKRKRCSFPELNARTLAHDPFAISGMQKYLRIETLGPLDHRRVKMRMRNRNGADAAARVRPRRWFRRPAMRCNPRADFLRRLQKQSALAYRKFRFGADPQKARRFFFEAVVMISRQPFERRPFLAGVTNKLPFIFANWTAWRRLRRFSANCVPHCTQIKFSMAILSGAISDSFSQWIVPAHCRCGRRLSLRHTSSIGCGSGGAKSAQTENASATRRACSRLWRASAPTAGLAPASRPA